MNCMCGHRSNCHRYAFGSLRNEGACLVRDCSCTAFSLASKAIPGGTSGRIRDEPDREVRPSQPGSDHHFATRIEGG